MTLRYPILCAAIVILAFLSSCKESDRTASTTKSHLFRFSKRAAKRIGLASGKLGGRCRQHQRQLSFLFGFQQPCPYPKFHSEITRTQHIGRSTMDRLGSL